MSLERAISQGFLFTFIERKTLQYQAFLSIKLVFYLRKQSSKLAKFGGLREGETNKKVTPNTNNDLAPAQNFVLNNPGNPVISGFLGIFLFEWLQIGYNAIIDKRRPKANVCEVMNIIGEIKDKNVVIIDDIIDTAGTLCNAANALKERGAKSVRACATHGVLSGPAIQRIKDSAIEELILLDTIQLPEEKHLEKIDVVTVAEVFAEAIKRIYNDQCLSSLFD